MKLTGWQVSSSSLLLLAGLAISGCMGTTHAVPPARTSIHLERLESIPDTGKKGKLVSELVKAHNGAVNIANQRAELAENLDKEAAKRQQEAEKLKASIEAQAKAHTYENVGHWLLESGLVAALIVIGAAF